MAKTVKKKKTDKAPASKKTVKTKKTVKVKAKTVKVAKKKLKEAEIPAPKIIANNPKPAKAKSGKKLRKKETPIVVPATSFNTNKSKKEKVEASVGIGEFAAKAKKTHHGKREDSTPLAEAVIKGLQDKKGKKIVWLNLSNVENAVADHFIICEAESTTQVNALGRSVEEVVREEVGEKPWHSEGKQNAQWILVDYVSVVVHIFQTEMREFYNLEALWADAEVMEVELQD